MLAGRPLKFQSVEELQKKIDAYFEVTSKDEWTWTGLALFLDTDKETLKDYRENREGFIAPLKNAMLKVENGYEIDLKKHGRTGTIFALKNFDWKDKNDHALTDGEGNPLNMSPVVNILGYKEFNTSTNAGSQKLVEGFLGAETDREDQKSASTDGKL